MTNNCKCSFSGKLTHNRPYHIEHFVIRTDIVELWVSHRGVCTFMLNKRSAIMT